MSGTLAFSTGNSILFPTENRISAIGVSRSHRSISFTSRGPSKTAIQAFAQTATRTRADAVKKSANLYQILRVKETASPIEIKAAYRSLAKQYHPDASFSSEPDASDFIEIHNAYATLSDPMARARYDLSIGSTRRFSYAAAMATGFSGQTRRWETDQCW
ncbi:PREDICTED: chaperone protein dnaJ 11, chloroplastic-like [Nelumbo nucifera]|uniref:J domain-containing protein n=2 Tax=Nelumbo nucifera TaxID=4432 RepID=A0A822XRV6_NELNU|nr:PREDICTED: chaperone protein dnaJ 11, chloroplastic-like [Nelumbo nucifera]DAD24334.1 TPA_asm: hypothetical protein HUJ06_025798 [Nelumbo nucifera]